MDSPLILMEPLRERRRSFPPAFRLYMSSDTVRMSGTVCRWSIREREKEIGSREKEGLKREFEGKEK